MSSFEWKANAETRPPHDASRGGLFATATGQSLSRLAHSSAPATASITADNTTVSTSAIQSSPGDDLSPPNAVQFQNLNGIAVPISASAGWSTSPPRTKVYPSHVEHHVRVLQDSNNNDNESLQVGVALEFTNPLHDDKNMNDAESMMVKVAIAKTLVHGTTELALVATQFQEFVKSNWIDITADIDYTKVAEAVVDAVIQDKQAAGQTAGKATITAETIELTLGPFSEKARLLLTFQAESLYTYQAMSLSENANDIGTHALMPLWMVMPFAPASHEAGLCRFTLSLSVPAETKLLPTDQAAYGHLKDQMKETTILAVSELLSSNNNNDVGYKMTWDSLPPRSCGVLAWLALPNKLAEDDDFVHIERDLGLLSVEPFQTIQATLQVPSSQDAPSLQVPLPGHGPTMGQLYRLRVKMPKAKPRQQPLFVLNLALSDKSASTARCNSDTTTMRHRFNDLAVLRFLKRLESIPKLVQAGVLQINDIWMDAFLAFADTAPASEIHQVMFRIEQDVVESIGGIVQDIRSNNNNLWNVSTSLSCPLGVGVPVSTQPGAFRHHYLAIIARHVQALRGVQPGGGTDFSVGPRTITSEYKKWKAEAEAMLPEKERAKGASPCTFVEFDTDGGHQHFGHQFGFVDYLKCLRDLCEQCRVKNGVVTGFGSWLNQDCATNVARVLGSVPAQLALQVPEPGTEGLNHIFRRSFSAWVGALRQPPPLTLTISAGSVTYDVGRRRTANVVEVLALQRVGKRCENLPRFGPPNVSEEDYTKAVIQEVPACDELLFYIVSRLENAVQLASALEICTVEKERSNLDPKAHIQTEGEGSTGNFIAYDWLKVLSRKTEKGYEFSPLVSNSLAMRFEDEVSFRFNLASPSGRTSYLGRSRTVVDRAAIDFAHQPPKPQSPISFSSTVDLVGPGPSLFGSSQDCGLFLPFGAPAAAFGAPAAAFGAPATTFGAPATVSGVLGATPAAGGGLFGNASSAPAAAFGATPAAGGGSFGNASSAPAAAFGPPPAAGGGLFGPPAAAFGPPPGFSFRAPAANFGTPATNIFFNNSSRTSGPCFAKASEETDKPLWATAMSIPLGSSSPSIQDTNKLKCTFNEIALAQQLLRRDPNVFFFCDSCQRRLEPGEGRFHCYDCDNFDLCFCCRENHKLPLHRVHKIDQPGGPTSPKVVVEDPLVSSLLLTTKATSPPLSPPKRDQAIEWNRMKVKRFLFSVLHWWPLFRTTCSCCDRLPATITDELAQKIIRANTLEDLLNIATLVIDSLEREEASQ